MKYVIEKAKGAFYAGSEKLAQKGLKLRRYLSLNSVRKMVSSLHLSASSLLFRGVTRSEQKKILAQGKAAKKTRPKKRAKTKARAKKRR
ncbi:MAG: hypothetical protein WC488_04810 [Candidatus Micrarchaeia archaeon]